MVMTLKTESRVMAQRMTWKVETGMDSSGWSEKVLSGRDVSRQP